MLTFVCVSVCVYFFLSFLSLYTGGGMYVEEGVPLEVRASNFTACAAEESGGGIYAAALAASRIKASTFRDCTAGFAGGGIAITDGTVSVDDCTFVDCSVSVEVVTTTCLTLDMTDLFGDGWQGSYIYVMALQDYIDIKRAGLDLTTHLDVGGEDDGYTDDDDDALWDNSTITDDLTFSDDSSFTTITTTMSDGSSQTDSLCFDKSDGEDYVVVSTADLYAYEGAFTITSADRSITYIKNGAFARVYSLSPFEAFDTCSGSGGGAVHMSTAATVAVSNSTFTGCSTVNANGGTLAVVSDTPLTEDQTVLTVTDSTFGDSSSSHYGAIAFSTLSQTSFQNIEVVAKDANIDSLSGVFFNSGGSMTCTSTCFPGFYGNCTGVDDCFSCLIDECIACPAGSYLAAAGAASKSSCESCPEGKISVAGSSSCETCPVATYASDSASDTDGFGLTAGATFCATCPHGRINPYKSQTECSACASGYSAEANSTACSKCGVGTYADVAATPECISCEAGTYNPYTGMSTCLECSGQFYSTVGSTECDACLRNYYYTLDKDCVEARSLSFSLPLTLFLFLFDARSPC